MSVDLNQLEVSIMHLQREVAQQLVYLMNLARRLKARLCESAVEARFPKVLSEPPYLFKIELELLTTGNFRQGSQSKSSEVQPTTCCLG